MFNMNSAAALRKIIIGGTVALLGLGGAGAYLNLRPLPPVEGVWKVISMDNPNGLFIAQWGLGQSFLIDFNGRMRPLESTLDEAHALLLRELCIGECIVAAILNLDYRLPPVSRYQVKILPDRLHLDGPEGIRIVAAKEDTISP